MRSSVSIALIVIRQIGHDLGGSRAKISSAMDVTFQLILIPSGAERRIDQEQIHQLECVYCKQEFGDPRGARLHFYPDILNKK
jgi:hypothetical protein